MSTLRIHEFCGSAPARGWKRGCTGKLGAWKIICGVLLLCAATAIMTPAQTFTTLVNFNGSNGASPVGSLTQGTDGNLYGATFLAGGPVMLRARLRNSFQTELSRGYNYA